MRKFYLLPLVLWALLMPLCSSARASRAWTVTSPDGQVRLELSLTAPKDQSYPADKERLYWRAFYAGRVAVGYSPLGLIRNDAVFLDGLSPVKAGPSEQVQQTYRMLRGKRREVKVSANQRTVTFRTPQGFLLQVILRAQNDGVAFRYRFPEKSSKTYTIKRELTGFKLPAGGKVWAHPYDRITVYTPAYETYWKQGVPVGTAAPRPEGWAFPVLFCNPEGTLWGLISEADLDESYCGCHLEQYCRNGLYRIRFPENSEANGNFSSEPSWTLPWQTPWRLVILGDPPGSIVESTFVTDLSRASVLDDTKWIKPGRVSWSWLSDHDSPQDCPILLSFIDLAAQMGWEYSLVDANWTIMRNGTIHEVLAEGRKKGVGILLWYNSGGIHNSVSEKPRGLMWDPLVRRHEFALLKKWGVRGVKVDFFQSDKQRIIQLYLEILRDAAKYKIMVNFHGCTIPRGWGRTYPHLMGMEAVKGAECYSFDRAFTAHAPSHNALLPFTRNAIGPMDYTPVMFRDNVYPHITTYAHELALAVVFECGWIHFADAVKPYLTLPPEPKRFLKEVPAAWDDTLCPAGDPGKYVVLARRSGRKWFLGGVNGEDKERALSLPLSFLRAERVTLVLIEDGPGGRSFQVRRLEVNRASELKLKLLPYGGFAAWTPRD